jgi:hypothetical protein
MLEWLVLIILILAILALIYALGTGFYFFINLILIVILSILIQKDINKGMIKYFLISTIITVILLIIPAFIPLLEFLKKAFLVELTAAFIIIYLLAHLFQFIEKKYQDTKAKKPSKKPKKTAKTK